jgi:hypothetical protein
MTLTRPYSPSRYTSTFPAKNFARYGELRKGGGVGTPSMTGGRGRE